MDLRRTTEGRTVTRELAVTWDYLCPFARNAHEHVVTGLRTGADWDVTFVPFSLKQTKVDEDEPAVWEREDGLEESGVLALLAGVAARERFPESFLDVHLSLFEARHDDGDDIRDETVVRGAIERAGVDADPVFGDIRSGQAMETFRKQHEGAMNDHDVFGVPTFIANDNAAFVRLMSRPGDDAELAIETVERVVGMLTDWTDLNEFKWTRLPR